MTNDPVQGTQLADTLKLWPFRGASLECWKALLLARKDSPILAIIDRCHGDDHEALKLADYFLGARVDVLWLGQAPNLLPQPSNALIAALFDA